MILSTQEAAAVKSPPFSFPTDGFCLNDIIRQTRYDMTIQPIWKTISVDMTSALESGVVEFSVKIGSTTIYEGKAYADADGNCVVVLNDILRDYLGSQFTLTGQTYLDTKAVVAFTIAYGEDESETIKVLNDWSYEPTTWADNSPAILTASAIRWDYRTLRPLTIIGTNNYSWAFKDEDGNTVSSGSHTIAGGSETFFAAPTVPGSLTITIGSTTRVFPIGDYCDKGGLIYRNTLGGFDVLPIASLVENETYERNSYEVAGNNGSRQTHLRRDFRNAVTKTFTLRTPVLTDTEAAGLHNALGSVQAWLHTAERGYEAVTVKTNTWKRKTFKNEGRKRVVYELEVEFAQPMERR